MLNSLIFLHRWVGVALALFMLVGFTTGLSIALLGSPSATRAQQLARAAVLLPESDWLSLGDALRANAAAHVGMHMQDEPNARRRRAS